MSIVDGILPQMEEALDDAPAPLPIGTDPDATPAILSLDIARQRAEKYDYALGPDSPGVESLMHAVTSGLEGPVRNSAVSSDRLRIAEAKQQMVRSYMANRGGKPVDRGEIDMIMSLTDEQLLDPNKHLERKYASKIMTDALSKPGDIIDEALRENPEKANQIIDTGEDIIFKKEYAQRKLEEAQAKRKEQSWLGFGSDIIEDAVPFWSQARLSGVLQGAPNTSWLKGRNKEEQIVAFYLMDRNTAIQNLDKAIEELEGKSLLLVEELLQGMVNYSGMDAIYDNIITGIDSTIAVPGLGIVPASAVGKLAGAVKGVVKSTSGPVTKTAEVLQGNGQVGTSAALQAAKAANGEATTLPTKFDDIAGQAFTLFNPGKVLEGKTDLSVGATNIIKQVLESNQELAKRILSANVPVDRLPIEILEQLKFEATELWKQSNPNLSDYVLGVDLVHDRLSNVYSAGIRLGDKGAGAKVAPQKAVGEPPKPVSATSTPTATPPSGPSAALRAAQAADGPWPNPNPGKPEPRAPQGTLRPDNDIGSQTFKEFGPEFGSRFQATRPVTLETAKFTKTKTSIPGPANDPGERSLFAKQAAEAADKASKEPTQVSVKMGDHNLDLFSSPDIARTVAKDFYGLKNFEIKQQGQGWYIEVLKNIDETSESARKALALEVNNATSRSLASTFIGALRSPEGFLSKELLEERKNAVYGSSGLVKLMKEMVTPLTGISKGEKKRLFDFLKMQRDMDNPVTKERGYFSDNIGIFEKDWFSYHKRLPTENEAKAYFVYRQLNDLDYAINNLAIYRDKSRLGLQNHTLPVKGVSDVPTNLEGKIIKEIPWQGFKEPDPEADILFWDNGPLNTTTTKFSKKSVIDEINKDVAAGKLKVIHLSTDGAKKLKEHPLMKGKEDSHPIFVVTSSLETSPLSYKQIPYRPGGHVMYDYPYYLRQASVRQGKNQAIYTGDINLVAIENEAKGRKYEKLFNEARLKLKNGDQGARAFVEKHLPMKYSEFTRLFSKDGPLDIDQKIVLTESGSSVNKTVNLGKNYKNFHSLEDSRWNLTRGEVNLRFATERGENLKTINERGSKANPLLSLAPAENIDPYEAINRSTGSLLRGRYVDDLKIKSYENYIAEFGDILDYTKEELWTNPMNALLEGKLKPNAPLADRRAAENYRRAALELFQAKSPTQEGWEFLLEKLASSMYTQKGGNLRGQDIRFIGSIKDPIQVMKNFAFHLKLGLFNPAQLILQMQGFTHIAGVEGPIAASRAVAQAHYMGLLRLNNQDKVVKHLASKASEWGGRGDHFLESAEAFYKTGFFNVNREVADLGDFLDPVITNGPGRTMVGDLSTGFFRKGEQITRAVAWNASYNRWRAANPNARFNDAAQKEVLQRADLLTVNMSAASNASWQNGLLSVPTQFFSYHARLLEQFMGKQLTPTEKLRALGTYSLIYGVPTALGVNAVWPVHEKINKELLERGIDTNSSNVAKLMHQGLMGFIAQGLTGNEYNLSERLGPGGLSFFKDLLTGEKNPLELAMGVSGTLVKDMFMTAAPMYYRVMVNLDTSNDDRFPLMAEDLLQVARNISTFNQAERMWGAINAGAYINKHEQRFANNLGLSDGILMMVTGATPQAVQDYYGMIESNKDREALQRPYRRNIEAELQRGYNALERGDLDAMNEHWQRAKTYGTFGGFTPEELMGINTRFLRNGRYNTVLEKQFMDFMRADPTNRERLIEKYVGKVNQ